MEEVDITITLKIEFFNEVTQDARNMLMRSENVITAIGNIQDFMAKAGIRRIEFRTATPKQMRQYRKWLDSMMKVQTPSPTQLIKTN